MKHLLTEILKLVKNAPLQDEPNHQQNEQSHSLLYKINTLLLLLAIFLFIYLLFEASSLAMSRHSLKFTDVISILFHKVKIDPPH